jgi:acetyltransferase-like isoleucine patch superfamily enzyme
MIGDETIILDNDYHPVNSNSPKCAPVYLEDRVWLATRVIVLRGVRVGEGSVIGAGSVVTQSIPPYSFAAGVPARVIKSLKK